MSLLFAPGAMNEFYLWQVNRRGDSEFLYNKDNLGEELRVCTMSNKWVFFFFFLQNLKLTLTIVIPSGQRCVFRDRRTDPEWSRFSQSPLSHLFFFFFCSILTRATTAKADLHISPQLEASLKPQPGEKFNLVPLTAAEEAEMLK